jgi:hypothetical protein
MSKSKGTRRYENPPPKTSAPVKHLAGRKLSTGDAADKTLAGSVERHIQPRRPSK